MNIVGYFNDFLADIRLTQNQKSDLKKGHNTLRDRIWADDTLKKIIVNTFLQGSYKRGTAIRPVGDKRADVDVIVVTNLDRNKVTPEEVIGYFEPFLEKHYKGKYQIQGRSIGIELSYVDLDIVVTSAPSEVDKAAYNSRSVQTELSLDDFSATWPWKLNKSWLEPDISKAYNSLALNDAVRKEAEWKLEPLYIPDRDAKQWVQTHPLAQIQYSRDLNAQTQGCYINVVKALKWWKLVKLPDPKHPKGYPLEHVISIYCPSTISSVPEGVVLSLEKFLSANLPYRQAQSCPFFSDHGVPSHDVWKRISNEDFVAFYDAVKSSSDLARKAFDAESISEQVKLWKGFFGSKFPDPPAEKKETNSNGGFTERTSATKLGDTPRFA